MSSRSPFYDDWLDCLRAHYRYVVETQDTITESSLRLVLTETGFTDGDIEAILAGLEPAVVAATVAIPPSEAIPAIVVTPVEAEEPEPSLPSIDTVAESAVREPETPKSDVVQQSLF